MKRILFIILTLPLFTNAQIKVYNPGQAFTCITTDKHGDIWAGTQGNGLWKCRMIDIPVRNTLEDEFYKYSTKEQFNKYNIQSVAADQDAHIWVGHNGNGTVSSGGSYMGGGIDVFTIDSQYDSYHYTPYSRLTREKNGGLPSLNSKAIAVDKNGTVWTANGYHDLFLTSALLPYINQWGLPVAGIPAQYILTCGGIAYKTATSIVFDSINTAAAKIPYGDNTVNPPISKTPGTRQCVSIAAGPTEVFAGLGMYESEKGIVGSRILRFNLDGTSNGYFDNANSPLPLSATSPARAIALYFQSNGTAWAGFSAQKGIGIYKNGEWKYVEKLTDSGRVSKLLPNGFSLSANSSGLIAGKGAKVFIGTISGLLMYKGRGDYGDDSSYILFTTVEGLPSNNIKGVATDEKSVWIATDNGIARMPINSDLYVYHLDGYPVNQYTTTDRTLLNSIDRFGSDDIVSYIAADNSKATIFLFKSSNAKSLKFSIKENPNADVETNKDEFGYFTILERGEDSLKVQYHHPKFIPSFYLNKKFNGREVTLHVIDSTNDKVVLEAKIKYVLPPVLFVHGVWSSVKALEPMSKYLRDNPDGYQYFDFQLLKIWRTDEMAEENLFAADAWQVPNGIQQLITNCATNNLSAGKVNVLCHSRGGLYTRAYIEELPPNIPYRYDINSLITFNTPHSGSQWANLMLDNRIIRLTVPDEVVPYPDPTSPSWTYKTEEFTLGDLLSGVIPIGDRKSKNGAQTLLVNKGLIKDLNEEENLSKIRDYKVPVHAFATNFELCKISPALCNQVVETFLKAGSRWVTFRILFLLYKVPSLVDDFIRDNVFNQEKNDFIVPKSSMEAGLNDQYLSRMDGDNISHSDLPLLPGIMANKKISAKVVELLKQNLYESKSNFSFNGYDPPRGTTRLHYNLFPWLSNFYGNPTPENRVLDNDLKNTYVRIDSLIRRKKINITDTLKVRVFAGSTIKKLLIVYQQTGDGDGDDDKTYSDLKLSLDSPLFSFPIPTNFYGKVNITTYGFGDSLLLAMDTSHIVVGLSDTTKLLKIMIDGDKEIRINERDAVPITVKGLYSDSVIRDLTNSDRLRYVIRDTSVIAHNSNNEVQGKKIGYSNLITVYGTNVDSIHVDVRENPLNKQTLLDNFTGIIDSSNNIQLRWITYQEFRNSYFVVERSNNSIFDSVGVINGNGTLYTTSNYKYTDKKFTGDTIHYRLRIVDSTSRSVGSRIITIVKAAIHPQTNLNDFAGVVHRTQLQLNWTTQREYNLKYFAIEKSRDSTLFDSIGVVIARGNSSIASSYNYKDSAYNHTKLFYRLKLVDAVGNVSYSEVLTFTYNITYLTNVPINTNFEIKMYPNPASYNLNLSVQGLLTGAMQLQIINMAGQTFFTKSILGANANIAISLPAIPEGLYLVEIRNIQGTKVFMGKLIIRK